MTTDKGEQAPQDGGKGCPKGCEPSPIKCGYGCPSVPVKSLEPPCSRCEHKGGKWLALTCDSCVWGVTDKFKEKSK